MPAKKRCLQVVAADVVASAGLQPETGDNQRYVREAGTEQVQMKTGDVPKHKPRFRGQRR